MSAPVTPFGRVVRALLAERPGLRQADLAGRMGYTTSAVSMQMRQPQVPGARVLREYAAALGVSLDRFAALIKAQEDAK